MNPAYLHLLLNHVPVIGVPIALLVLIAGILWKRDEFARVALLIFVFCAVLTIPVYFTGEPAEHRIEHLPGVSNSNIDEHEEAAEVSFAAVSTLGVIAIAGMYWFRRYPAFPRWFVITVLIASVLVSSILARTAHLGGLIRHPEMTNSQPPVPEHEE